MHKTNMLAAADAYDLLTGLSRLTGSALIADVAKVIGDLNPPDFSNALNTKQLASKIWLLDETARHMGVEMSHMMVLGGWHGVLSALFLNDPRFNISHATSIDLDPACAPVAALLNRRFVQEGRFEAKTADMFLVNYAPLAGQPTALVINTSCEHIPDLRGWLALLPKGQRVVLQSNDYRAIPEHIACVSSADELAELAMLSECVFSGALATRKYNRFMVMGQT
jgi:hypothetical protein